MLSLLCSLYPDDHFIRSVRLGLRSLKPDLSPLLQPPSRSAALSSYANLCQLQNCGSTFMMLDLFALYNQRASMLAEVQLGEGNTPSLPSALLPSLLPSLYPYMVCLDFSCAVSASCDGTISGSSLGRVSLTLASSTPKKIKISRAEAFKNRMSLQRRKPAAR